VKAWRQGDGFDHEASSLDTAQCKDFEAGAEIRHEPTFRRLADYFQSLARLAALRASISLWLLLGCSIEG